MKKNFKEIIEYVFVGGMTTAVNYFCYFGINNLTNNWLLANSLAWVAAVIFAYYANKYFVFKSVEKSVKEIWEFFGLRFVTLIVENVLLYILINVLIMDGGVSKVLVSVITVLGNYYLCKFRVFRKGMTVYE